MARVSWRRTLHLAGLLTALAARISVASAQADTSGLPPYRYRLLGVYDMTTGDPLEGAEVTDLMTRTSARTSKTGTVTLMFLPDGGSPVRIQKLGFRPSTMMAVISPADTVPLMILLERTTQQLPTVITTDSSRPHTSPGLNAFEERRKTGVGQFITESQLRKNDGKTMTSMVRTLTGVNVSCGKVFPHPCIALSARVKSKLAILGGNCKVQIYVDAALWPDDDLERLAVTEFAGVEYYSGANIPAQYNRTDSVCGVLLLWSRER